MQFLGFHADNTNPESYDTIASLKPAPRWFVGVSEFARLKIRWQIELCKPDPIRFDEAMFPYVTLTKDKEWQPGPYGVAGRNEPP